MAEGSVGRPASAHVSTKHFPALTASMSEVAAAVEAVLDQVLPKPGGLHGRAAEAMRYAVFAGGKRLRPFLTVAGARLFDVPDSRSLRAAAAIEALHTYSLVHDDLPCMDDDDLRRGRPTTHKAFDEATAVLAGDGLLTVAFEILSDPGTHPSGEVRAELVGRLARAGGADGMIGGQMIDMLSAERTYDADQIILLQRMKTGALFEFSAEAGAILSQAGPEHQRRFRDYARDLGLAFQIADDLIDVLGETEQAGKAVGKDVAQGKATLVSIHGIDGARREALRLAESAAERLAVYDNRAAAADLRALPFLLLDRAS